MNKGYHYYATYCASRIAGFNHDEALAIGYCSQMVDVCSKGFLMRIQGPVAAATTQLQLELVNARTDPIGLQDITRIWSSFHFLPGDLYAQPERGTRRYREKYRLICGPNGQLVAKTVELARNKGLQAMGVAMHVLADTWAHRYFAGTPSMAINDTNYSFVELLPEGDGFRERPIKFRHNPAIPDDFDQGLYTNTINDGSEISIMSLGHGRAGHLPDYGFMRYRYMPAWNNYREVVKDNQSDFYHAFCQMVYALGCLRRGEPFVTERYATSEMAPYEGRVREILALRQYDPADEWRSFAESSWDGAVEPPDPYQYEAEYKEASGREKDATFLGRFITAALAQKSMVTHEIYESGNRLAGRSINYDEHGFGGIVDYMQLVFQREGAGARE